MTSEHQSIEASPLKEYLENNLEDNSFLSERIEPGEWLAYEENGEIHIVSDSKDEENYTDQSFKYESLEDLRQDLEQRTHEKGRFNTIDKKGEEGDYNLTIYDTENQKAWIESSMVYKVGNML